MPRSDKPHRWPVGGWAAQIAGAARQYVANCGAARRKSAPNRRFRYADAVRCGAEAHLLVKARRSRLQAQTGRRATVQDGVSAPQRRCKVIWNLSRILKEVAFKETIRIADTET